MLIICVHNNIQSKFNYKERGGEGKGGGGGGGGVVIAVFLAHKGVLKQNRHAFSINDFIKSVESKLYY